MYSIERLAHNISFTRRQQGGLTSLALNYVLFQFAVGMVSMFGVLFIYQLAENFFQGLLYILLFFGLQRAVVALSVPMVAKYISTVGYRYMMLAGLIFLALKLVFFTYVTSNYLIPLLPALIFGGLAISSYYLSYHGLFLDDNDDSKIGEQIGLITMLGRLSMVASPFIAGVLVDLYSFPIMFNVTVGLLIISAIPLFMMKHHKRHGGSFSMQKVWEFINKRTKISWSLFMWSFTDGVQAFYWPLFLFLILKSYTTFGIVGSVVLVFNSIAVYLFGKAYDKSRLNNVFLGSSILVSASWIMRFLSLTPLFAVVSDIFNRLISPLWWMKIRRQELLAGERVDSLVFGAAHELVVTFAYLTALLFSTLLLFISQGTWTVLIVPIILATIASTFILGSKTK